MPGLPVWNDAGMKLPMVTFCGAPERLELAVFIVTSDVVTVPSEAWVACTIVLRANRGAQS